MRGVRFFFGALLQNCKGQILQTPYADTRVWSEKERCSSRGRREMVRWARGAGPMVVGRGAPPISTATDNRIRLGGPPDSRSCVAGSTARATPDFELQAYDAHLNADQSYLQDDEHQPAQDEADVIRQVGISEQMFYRWKKKQYADPQPDRARERKQLRQ
jgi:hypothetical protein